MNVECLQMILIECKHKYQIDQYIYSIDEVVCLDLGMESITVVEAISIRKEYCRVILLNVVIWDIVYIMINTTLDPIIVINHSKSSSKYYWKLSIRLWRESNSLDLISEKSWIERNQWSKVERWLLRITVWRVESIRLRKYISRWLGLIISKSYSSRFSRSRTRVSRMKTVVKRVMMERAKIMIYLSNRSGIWFRISSSSRTRSMESKKRKSKKKRKKHYL